MNRSAKKQGVLVRLRTIRLKRSAHRADEDFCAICEIGYDEDDRVISLPCNKNHYFHSKCIRAWLTSAETCPVCKRPIVL